MAGKMHSRRMPIAEGEESPRSEVGRKISPRRRSRPHRIVPDADRLAVGLRREERVAGTRGSYRCRPGTSQIFLEMNREVYRVVGSARIAEIDSRGGEGSWYHRWRYRDGYRA